ncbi:hypothetical protein TOPH_08786 [Tolypocladium ophioglossoides CBS 100239]|uniref:Protein HRI1 n=1 Tax=Tolypocladium ophioglossoides (strain CBS 100239) TaxID=1163406 RepID=A0A0L0MXR1_TOLOC|nr:hypothetical protein TOPH_08786 [Tolypocladium ophioglossoides CBS 100239]
MGSVSIRRSIRWLPASAGETTATLVLTSPQRRFVDLRIVKPVAGLGAPLGDDDADELPLSRLDWAIAGTSSSSAVRTDGRGRQFTRSQWRHWIDSTTADAAGVVDEGDMFAQADGSTLETGSMVNPATGRVAPYEEVWDDDEAPTPPTATGRGVNCVVLDLDDGARRGRVVRLGRHCQGFVRAGEAIALERWEWAPGAGWRRTVRMGGLAMPCREVLRDDGRGLEVGDAAGTGHAGWKVVEVASI